MVNSTIIYNGVICKSMACVRNTFMGSNSHSKNLTRSPLIAPACVPCTLCTPIVTPLIIYYMHLRSIYVVKEKYWLNGIIFINKYVRSDMLGAKAHILRIILKKNQEIQLMTWNNNSGNEIHIRTYIIVSLSINFATCLPHQKPLEIV